MFPRIKSVEVRDNLILFVTFDGGEKVLYDLKDDIRDIDDFRPLETEIGLFKNYRLDKSRTCIYWPDRIDLASDAILEYGKRVD